jgi:hypothetical protein
MRIYTLNYTTITFGTHFYHLGEFLQTLTLFGKIFTLGGYTVHVINSTFSCNFMEKHDASLEKLDLLSYFPLVTFPMTILMPQIEF